MHILVVSQCFYPDNYHINQLVQDLADRGHRVTVLTGKPDYTTGRVPAEYTGFKKYHDALGKVDVWRVPIYARRKGALNRFVNYLSFMVNGSVLALLKKWEKFDVIYYGVLLRLLWRYRPFGLKSVTTNHCFSIVWIYGRRV